VSQNEPKEKKGFTLAFILGMMVMVGVIGAVLIGFHF
jgi:Tfp pilus assembly protein PilX